MEDKELLYAKKIKAGNGKHLGCKLFTLILLFLTITITGCEESYVEKGYVETGYAESVSTDNLEYNLTFRNEELLDEHYQKHGIDMGFSSAEEYELAANKVIMDKDTLHKLEEEDGDDVYYLESSNEFVVVSTDGYIRTYFYPNDGIDYFNRQ